MSVKQQRRQQLSRPAILARPAGVPVMDQVPAAILGAPSQGEMALVEGLYASIRALEKARGKPALVYYTADDAMMAADIADPLDHVLQGIGQVPVLDFVLESRGGVTEVPCLVIALLRSYSAQVSAIVPGIAHSAATATTLGANEILMTAQSQLGPTDPYRAHPLLPRPEGTNEPVPMSVQDLRRCLDFMKREIGEGATPETMATMIAALFDKVHPMAIGAIEQSYELSRQVCRNNLATHMTDAAAIDAIVTKLSDGYNTHTYPIMRAEARQLGLPIVDAEPWLVQIRGVHEAARALVRGKEATPTRAPQGYGSVRRRRPAVIASRDRAGLFFSEIAGWETGRRPEETPPVWFGVAGLALLEPGPNSEAQPA